MLQVTRTKSDGFDFYKTLEWVTKILLEEESFEGNILEPACEALKNFGYENSTFGRNFLLESKPAINVITNPPFTRNMPLKFMHKCEEICSKKYALLLHIRYLCGNRRLKFYSKVRAPKKIIPIAKKIDFGGGAWYEFAWFIWDKEYTGETQVVWKEVNA